MLGGNQFNNNLGNQIIIKCHECGDTNLRYVDFSRTDGDPSGYVCGNGHETWGAVDDWEIWGQTDMVQTKVPDTTCESLKCKLPNSISVQFSGITGVQARESCAHRISEDIRSRTSMPYSRCGPCCDSNIDLSSNASWYINCGCDSLSGPCSKSNDYTQNPYANQCAKDIQTITTTCLGVSGYLVSVDIDTIQVFENVPGYPVGGSPGDSPFSNSWLSNGPSCAEIDPECTGCNRWNSAYISPGFFTGGYPDAYAGPVFINELLGSAGNLWENAGMTIKFIVREQRHFEWLNPCSLTSPCCEAGKRTFYIAKRSHPTANATGNSGFTWSVSQEGIGTKEITYSCGVGGCEANWESPNIDPYSFINFCDPSNAAVPCTNCNNSIGSVSVSMCEGNGERRFWPFRVPYFKDAEGDAYQLTRYNRASYPTYGECECILDGCNSTDYPEYCFKNVAYPNCLENGTLKCLDEDGRYKVECANPTGYFLGTLVNNANSDIFQYRYSIDLAGANTTKDVDDVLVTINPIFVKREFGADVFRYPESPNPLCAGTAQEGWVPYFGDPNPTNPGEAEWFSINHPNYPDGGAIGIRTARFGQLFAAPDDIVQQPHCLRRVKNPNLADIYPFYQVNTDDVSRQRMILDRYYPTSEIYDYAWSGVKLSEPDIRDQAFMNKQGDRGNIDYLSGQLYPYAFVDRSGSYEEPELVAVIHSSNGKGGQIAFQTMPVSYETERLTDPADNLDPVTGYCKYKTRVSAQGYGVMYPLIDDPIWSTAVSEPFPDTYDPNYQPTTQKTFEYPVWIPGTGYEIGDKIEFRAWKTLQHDSNTFDINGNPLVDEYESVWEEECIETTIATATITELNDERITPAKVDQVVPDGKIHFTTSPAIPSGSIRYHETYSLNYLNVVHYGSGYASGDVIDIRFTDNDGLGGIVNYDVYPSAVVTDVRADGRILSVEIAESGRFYKTIRTGGIRWYEFDETDDNGDLLISVGNCPCSYDVCSEECNGCVSKELYPSDSHPVIEAVQGGFPAPPHTGCVTIEGIEDSEQQKIVLWCGQEDPVVSCESSCAYTARYAGGGLGWMLLNQNLCKNDCSCGGYPSTTPSSGQVVTSSCYCSKPSHFTGAVLISGWTDLGTFAPMCWPLNKTYEFYPDNYARSACSGLPEIPGHYAYMQGREVIPYRRPQYRQEWLPNVSGFLASYGRYMPDSDDEEAMGAVRDAFLSYDSCNPGKYDKFNRSYRWLTQYDSGKPPCRKKINFTDTIPSGVERTLDNYCRVYGFYQQRQPSCEVLYQGQYIMRAGYKGVWTPAGPDLGDCGPTYFPNETHEFTGCDPIIADIKIALTPLEAQFDISVGAPYDQDYLIPENLPTPIKGPDGFLESRADAWNYPSLTGVNNGRFFDHGFYEPNRLSDVHQMALPENQSAVLAAGNQLVKTPVFTVNPLFGMSDVNGNDMNPVDAGNSGVHDWPDPRNNCTATCSGYALPLGELYPKGNVPLPATGIQNNFVYECLYPWENLRPTDDVDHYCMFKNNSAEFVLGQIEECDNCTGSVLIYDRSTDPLPGPFYDEYGYFLNYTYIVPYGSIQGTGSQSNVTTDYYVMFRAFGSETNNSVQKFKIVVDDYINVWTDRFNSSSPVPLNQILLQDTHRSILWNMLFTELPYLTKVEVFTFATETENGSYSNTRVVAWRRWFIEDRCEFYEKTGTIKSINVLNPGAGYSFEIEERVPLSGLVQNVPDAILTVDTTVKSPYRRRETYQISDVSIAHTGTGYSIGDTITIKYNDKDYARDKIHILSNPSVTITDVSDSGTIKDWEIANSGEFYKYMKTGVHRAFPMAMVLNNYWDYPNGQQNFGKHAKLVPVIGVDPEDPKTYGRVKRVDVEYGGVDYVQPGQYWSIATTMGDYDDYGNIKNGLDIQHLVDPCKYTIYGSGFTSEQVEEYYQWMRTAENDPDGSVFFPERQSFYSQSPNEDVEPSIGDPFTRSLKYYLNTDNNKGPVTWSSKVGSWNNIIVSGYCPVDAAGGLLNKSYGMALVEEANIHSNRAYTGDCTKEQCDQYIDRNHISCNEPAAYLPGNEDMKECGMPCPIFTVYDAHRFNVEHTSQMREDIYVTPSPWLLGCQERLPLNTEERTALYCYDTYGIPHGGQLSTQGFSNWDMIGSQKDKCHDGAIYSLYAEFGKWTNGANRTNVPAMRVKAITYAMDGPISMKISYNDDRPDIPIKYDKCDLPE